MLLFFLLMCYLEKTLTYQLMKKMRFTLASLLLVGFLATSVMTSCGGKKEEAAETKDTTTTDKAEEHPAEGGEHPKKDATSNDTPA
jgi:hypothetical protein